MLVGDSMRAKRDYAMLAMLFGCGFRRSELVRLPNLLQLSTFKGFGIGGITRWFLRRKSG